MQPSLILFICYCFFSAVQLFFYTYFFSRLAFYKHKDVKQAQIPISIIVCAHNEMANLRKYLPKILEQDYFKDEKYLYEVLVVDDNSSDDSPYLLNDLKKIYPHLTVLHLSQESKNMRGKKFPLSMGIKQARYKHVLLTDADCEPSSLLWLQNMANGFQQKSIVLGYSPFFKRKGALNRSIRFETFYGAFQYLSLALAKVPYMGVGRNLAYDRQLFFDNKGFSSHQHLLSGDDDLFINQVADCKNTAIVIHPDAFTKSEAKATRLDWQYQKQRHLSTGYLYKLKHKLLLGLLAFSHFYIYFGLAGLVLSKLFLLIGLGLFLFRWIVVLIFQGAAMKKLKEDDLVPWILYYDVWIILYYIKNIPSIFFRRKTNRWK